MEFDKLNNNSNDNLCSICLKTEPVNQLICICNCKIQSHSKCLVELNSQNKLINCQVCNSKYKINEPYWCTFSGITIEPQIDTRLFFPHNDLYYQPSFSSDTLVKVEQMERLTFSILYLQVDRVKDLLEEHEILENLPGYYFGYSDYKQTPLIALAQGNLSTNAHINFGDNKYKYIEIFTMLLNTNKINLDHIDRFELKLSDYLARSKIKELKNLLVNKIIYDIQICMGENIYKFYAGKELNVCSLNKYKNNSSINSMDLDLSLSLSLSLNLNNKFVRRIYDILIQIEKLSNGKIKTYRIFNKLELEIIYQYTKSKNIPNQIIIKPIEYSKMKRYFNTKEICKKSYENFIEHNSIYSKYFIFSHSDLEHIQIKKEYFFGIRIYKGYSNLNKQHFDSNNQFQIYL